VPLTETSLAGISAAVIADSVSFAGSRLTTVLLRYPRFIHAEVLTYRQASRNSASSRARSFRSMILSALDTPASPVEWGLDQTGMSAREILTSPDAVRAAENDWLAARDSAVLSALRSALGGEEFSACRHLLHSVGLREFALFCLTRLDSRKADGTPGLHKQIVNRHLEPYLFHETILTANEPCFSNIFAQRIHPDAQPEFRVLAVKSQTALATSIPQHTPTGSFHLPFVTEEEKADAALFGCVSTLTRLSVARCARASYRDWSGKVDEQADLYLFTRLASASPPHLSPFEHVASAISDSASRSGNFTGWTQLRQTASSR
jgi:hypothetical protein